MAQRPRPPVPSPLGKGGALSSGPQGRGGSLTLGLLAVLLAATLWAVAANVARSLFDDGLDPILLTEARAFLAFIGLAALRPWRRPAAGRTPMVTIVVLGLAIAFVNATYYIAIERLEVAVAIVIQYTAPALVVGWIAFGRRKKPSMDVLLALVIAIGGVVLAAGIGSKDLGAISGIGLLAAGGSAILFAVYTLLSEKVEASYGAAGAMLRAFGVAAAFWLLFQTLRGWPAALFDSDNLARVLYVGFAGTFAPFLLYVWGLRKVSAERAVIAATTEPVLAAVVAWAWFSQRLSLLQIAGGLLVLIAVVSLQIGRRRTLRPPEP